MKIFVFLLCYSKYIVRMSTSSKKALLIGINYSRLACRLQGCINDIVNMRAMLIDAYAYAPANIILLRDDDAANLPTRANILAAMANLAAQSGNLSEIAIHYSGHGTQMRDTNGDETDGLDEVIVPCDFPTAGFITDDVLFGLLQTFRCRTWLFFDSCNSGSVCDLQYSIQYANGALVRQTASNKSIASNPNILVMSGCKDTQTSADTYDAQKAQAAGAFTAVLIECLRNGQHNIDVLRLYSDVCSTLVRYGFTQTPVLSSSGYVPQYTFVRGGSNVADAKTLSLSTAVTKTVLATPATTIQKAMVPFGGGAGIRAPNTWATLGMNGAKAGRMGLLF